MKKKKFKDMSKPRLIIAIISTIFFAGITGAKFMVDGAWVLIATLFLMMMSAGWVLWEMFD